MQKISKILIVLVVILAFFINSKALAHTVEYRGEAEGIVAVPEDFFADFGNLLPGDVKEDKVIIRNTTRDNINIYFKTDISKDTNISKESEDILKLINLQISLKDSKGERIIYQGNLEAKTLSSQYILLGSYEKNFDGEFKFKIEVPKELKNSYSLAENEVKWIFYVEKLEDNKTNDDGKENNNNNNNTNKNDNNIINNIIKNVKTGDYIYYIVGLIAVLIIINIIIICIRRKDEDEK